MRKLLLVLTLIPALCGLSSAKKSDMAVLVMAHGGSPLWNKTVEETVKKADIPYPTRVYFGMAHSRDEVDRLQSEVNYLQGKGARTIIVVPLLVSSYSEIYRQWKYLLGENVHPGFNTPFFPIEKRAEIQFAEPLNDDPITGLILVDRAREISQASNQETVILVAHGPNDDSDNAKWLRMLGRLCDLIRDRGHFKNVVGMTLRDDAPTEVRSQAVAALRSQVEAVSKAGGRTLIIPLLIAPGGIENKIGIALKGLEYTFNGKTLLPDNRISQWIRSKVP